MTHLNRHRYLSFCLLLAVAALLVNPLGVQGWGEQGHLISGRAAAMKLPVKMPLFFRLAVNQLSYLNPEPDRWRARSESDLDPALNAATAPDHFIDMEWAPEAALNAPDRFGFIAEISKTEHKPNEVGFVPFRILELFQRLRVEFRLWRAEKDLAKKRWIEQRIINDAGILGHYVADGSNPHHTTIHHNGWVGDNPKGYTAVTRERGIHGRFESEYVRTHMQLKDILPLLTGPARVLEKPRQEIWAYLRASHAKVEELYELDKREPFGEMTASLEHKRFTAERLAAGAQMLRDLWWTAWVTSEFPLPTPTPTPTKPPGK